MSKLNLANIVDDLADAECDLSSLGVEDTLTVTYRPSAYTPALESRMAAAVTATDLAQSEPVVELLLGVLVSWELENNGEPVDTDEASLRSLPVMLLLCVMNGIGESMSGKAPTPQLPR